jgi:hypothetical protein
MPSSKTEPYQPGTGVRRDSLVVGFDCDMTALQRIGPGRPRRSTRAPSVALALEREPLALIRRLQRALRELYREQFELG